MGVLSVHVIAGKGLKDPVDFEPYSSFVQVKLLGLADGKSKEKSNTKKTKTFKKDRGPAYDELMTFNIAELPTFVSVKIVDAGKQIMGMGGKTIDEISIMGMKIVPFQSNLDWYPIAEHKQSGIKLEIIWSPNDGKIAPCHLCEKNFASSKPEGDNCVQCSNLTCAECSAVQKSSVFSKDTSNRICTTCLSAEALKKKEANKEYNDDTDSEESEDGFLAEDENLDISAALVQSVKDRNRQSPDSKQGDHRKTSLFAKKKIARVSMPQCLGGRQVAILVTKSMTCEDLVKACIKKAGLKNDEEVKIEDFEVWERETKLSSEQIVGDCEAFNFRLVDIQEDTFISDGPNVRHRGASNLQSVDVERKRQALNILQSAKGFGDHLNLNDQPKTLALIAAEGKEQGERVLFSDYVKKVNKANKAQKRVIAITQHALYNMKAATFGGKFVMNRRIPISQISCVEVEMKKKVFLIHVRAGADLMVMYDRHELFYEICQKLGEALLLLYPTMYDPKKDFLFETKVADIRKYAVQLGILDRDKITTTVSADEQLFEGVLCKFITKSIDSHPKVFRLYSSGLISWGDSGDTQAHSSLIKSAIMDMPKILKKCPQQKNKKDEKAMNFSEMPLMFLQTADKELLLLADSEASRQKWINKLAKVEKLTGSLDKFVTAEEEGEDEKNGEEGKELPPIDEDAPVLHAEFLPKYTKGGKTIHPRWFSLARSGVLRWGSHAQDMDKGNVLIKKVIVDRADITEFLKSRKFHNIDSIDSLSMVITFDSIDPIVLRMADHPSKLRWMDALKCALRNMKSGKYADNGGDDAKSSQPNDSEPEEVKEEAATPMVEEAFDDTVVSGGLLDAVPDIESGSDIPTSASEASSDDEEEEQESDDAEPPPVKQPRKPSAAARAPSPSSSSSESVSESEESDDAGETPGAAPASTEETDSRKVANVEKAKAAKAKREAAKLRAQKRKQKKKNKKNYSDSDNTDTTTDSDSSDDSSSSSSSSSEDDTRILVRRNKRLIQERGGQDDGQCSTATCNVGNDDCVIM